MLQWPFDHWLYRTASLLNLITFVPCRFGALCVIYYGMIYMRHRVSTIYFSFLFAAIFVMTAINIVLFYRLFKNDILRPMFASKKPGQTLHKTNAASKSSRSMMANGDAKAWSSNGGHNVNNNGDLTRSRVNAHEHQE